MSRRSDSGLDGILLIDKPAGWTSHDVVAKVRGITRQRRIGHTGTLDPMATGLLVLCLGQATRLVQYLTGHDKRYSGAVALGRTTTTDDAEGELLAESPVPPLEQSDVDRAAAAFRGAISQAPPAFSALKVGGRRAYDLARAGRPPELAERPVTIDRLEATLIPPSTLAVDVECSSGTYIRSLARDLGAALGCGGHLASLRRHSAGPFSLEDAVSLEALERAVAAGELEDLLIPLDDAINDFDAAILSGEAATIVANGGHWRSPQGAERAAERARIYADSGAFVAVASVSSLGEIRPKQVFLRQKSAK